MCLVSLVRFLEQHISPPNSNTSITIISHSAIGQYNIEKVVPYAVARHNSRSSSSNSANSIKMGNATAGQSGPSDSTSIEHMTGVQGTSSGSINVENATASQSCSSESVREVNPAWLDDLFSWVREEYAAAANRSSCSYSGIFPHDLHADMPASSNSRFQFDREYANQFLRRVFSFEYLDYEEEVVESLRGYEASSSHVSSRYSANFSR